MVDSSTIGYLKQAIHDLQRSVNESNKTNRVLILCNLINSGVINIADLAEFSDGLKESVDLLLHR